MSEPAKPDVPFDAFASLDLRVGEVLSVEDFPQARKPSWRLTIDLGDLGVRRSSAQLTDYAAQELVGRRVVCAVNLGQRRIAGFVSQVLVLGAYRPDGTVALLGVDDDAPPGAVVG